MFDFDPQTIDLKKRKVTVDDACLDCESPETVRNSIAKILDLSSDELVQFLSDFDFEQMPANFQLGSGDQGELMLKTILFNLECKWGFSHCSWFHLTRCSPKESFQAGLLPVPDVIDKIWKLLFDINSHRISNKKWNNFRKLFESSCLCHSAGEMQDYHDRITVLHHQGPNGVLIGDLSAIICLGQAHFFDTPEIINSICKAYSNDFGHQLADDFFYSTRPCVIKFRTACNKLRYLSKALIYLYETLQPSPDFVQYLDCSYIGNGAAISSKQIQKITFLENANFKS